MGILIKPIDLNRFDSFVELAFNNYLLERESSDELNEIINGNYFSIKLKELFAKSVSCMAIEGERVIGYLCFEVYLTSDSDGYKGAFCPLYGYGIDDINRGKIMNLMFQHLALILCETYVQKFSVNIYANDVDVIKTYVMSAFAMETTEVVRNTSKMIESKETAYIYKEVQQDELGKYEGDIIELYRMLINHLRRSPIFYHCNDFLPIEDRFNDYLSNDIRIFAVFDDESLIGIVSAEPPDCEFSVGDDEAKSLSDVIIKNSYRGQGIAAALLRFVNEEMKKSGIKRLYVTHGTINPTARNFWDNYFVNYSYLMSREIDSNMLGVIKSV